MSCGTVVSWLEMEAEAELLEVERSISFNFDRAILKLKVWRLGLEEGRAKSRLTTTNV